MTQETQQVVNLNFTFDINEANAILAALQELPAKVANPITAKLKEQAEVQIRAMQPVPAVEPTAEAVE
jgi:hypothetical protein